LEDRDPDDVDQRRRVYCSTANGAALRLADRRTGFGIRLEHATIAAMGVRALHEPALAGAAVAGAVLFTVATILQMAAVLAATSRSTPLYQMRFPPIAAGLAALAYGGLLTPQRA